LIFVRSQTFCALVKELCVSVDRVEPTEFTQKGLRPLRRKLEAVRRYASFQVETNTVLCEETLDGFEALVTELKELGFPVRCGVRHYQGRLELNDELREKLEWFHGHFRHWRIAPMMDLHYARMAGAAPSWKCTGGYKFLYVDEFGVVKACSQVALPREQNVLDMSVADLKANDEHKACEKDCGVSCVIQTSLLTANPLKYAARCGQHLLTTRGNGGTFGYFRNGGAEPVRPYAPRRLPCGCRRGRARAPSPRRRPPPRRSAPARRS
jgi:MoaA/NifB/PqqE/SkfB family radical SAM enzyme